MNKNIFKTTIAFVSMTLLIVIGVSPLLLNINKQDNSSNITTVNSASSPPIVQKGEIKTTASGSEHSGVVINDGTYDHLYTWGDNGYGQLGLGDLNDRYTPQEVFFNTNGVVGPEDIIIKDLYMGTWRSAAVITDNSGIDSLYLWGYYFFSYFKTPAKIIIPDDIEVDEVVTIEDVAMDTYATSVIVEDSNGLQHLYAWGENDRGQLGDPTLGAGFAEITFDDSTEIKDIEMSSGYSAAVVTVKGDDEVFTWGSASKGRLGQGDLEHGKIMSPTKVDFTPSDDKTTSPGDITSLELGNNHTSIVVNNNGTDELYMWGYNDDGELGLGSDAKKSYNTPQKISINGSGNKMTITDISAGKNNTLVSTIEKNKSHLYVTGWGEYGAIGNGSQDSQKTFLDITSFIPNFKARDEIYSIQMGTNYASIIVSNGKNNTLYTWGLNDAGQLGVGSNERYSLVMVEVLSVELIKSFPWLLVTLGVIGIIVLIVIIVISVYLSKKLLSKSDLRKADKKQDHIKRMKVQEAIRSLQSRSH